MSFCHYFPKESSILLCLSFPIWSSYHNSIFFFFQATTARKSKFQAPSKRAFRSKTFAFFTTEISTPRSTSNLCARSSTATPPMSTTKSWPPRPTNWLWSQFNWPPNSCSVRVSILKRAWEVRLMNGMNYSLCISDIQRLRGSGSVKRHSSTIQQGMYSWEHINESKVLHTYVLNGFLPAYCYRLTKYSRTSL